MWKEGNPFCARCPDGGAIAPCVGESGWICFSFVQHAVLHCVDCVDCQFRVCANCHLRRHDAGARARRTEKQIVNYPGLPLQGVTVEAVNGFP